MRNSFKFAVFSFQIIALAMAISAQPNNVRTTVAVAGSQGAGFANPVYGVEAGGTFKIRRVTIDTQAHYLWARKIPGGGHNTGGNLAARIALGEGSKLFAGPAIAFARQTTNAYSKSAFSVGGEAGTTRNGFILSARVLQDFRSVNRVRAFDFRAERYGSRGEGKRVGLYTAVRVGASQFNCFPGRCWSARLFLSAGVYL